MRETPSPTARALLALEAIQDEPGITADRLARRLGVTPRAVRRYVGTLREADIPVESVRGPAGGYRLGRGTRLPPLVFSGDEALGLVMAVLDGHHRAADPDDPVGAAVAKLLRAMPAHTAERADAVRRTAAAAPDGSAARPDPATTVDLVRARAEGRRVRLAYRSEAGNTLDVEVEPWAVVVRHGRWYLLCRLPERDVVRAYRVDRVRSVTLLDLRFRAPDGLDPVAALEEHLASGWDHPTEVLVHAPLDRVHWLPRTLGRLEDTGDGRTRIVGSTSNVPDYAAGLARIPFPLTVVGGDELRDAVARLAARLTDSLDAPHDPEPAQPST